MRMRTASVALLSAFLAACGASGGTDSQDTRDRCLYAAVEAYPGLLRDKAVSAERPALDVVPECKGLNGDQKNTIRLMMARFVDSALSAEG